MLTLPYKVIYQYSEIVVLAGQVQHLLFPNEDLAIYRGGAVNIVL